MPLGLKLCILVHIFRLCQFTCNVVFWSGCLHYASLLVMLYSGPDAYIMPVIYWMQSSAGRLITLPGAVWCSSLPAGQLITLTGVAWCSSLPTSMYFRINPPYPSSTRPNLLEVHFVLIERHAVASSRQKIGTYWCV